MSTYIDFAHNTHCLMRRHDRLHYPFMERLPLFPVLETWDPADTTSYPLACRIIERPAIFMESEL